MLNDQLKQIAALKAKTAALEAQVEVTRKKQLAELPKQFGYASAEEFLAAFRAAVGKQRTGISAAVSPKSTKPTKRRRAKITDDTRAQVKKLVQAGRTGAEIAEALKISLPSVQNIKKALGLVRPAKK